MMHSSHSSHRSTNEDHVLQETEVTGAGKVPMLRSSCLCVPIVRDRCGEKQLSSQWWSIRTTGPECTGSQKNAGNCIFVTATSKHLVSVMRGSTFWLTKYICKRKRADPPHMITGYHNGVDRTSNLKTNFICCMDSNYTLMFEAKCKKKRIEKEKGGTVRLMDGLGWLNGEKRQWGH